uniref:Programmed cell death protein 2 C-terminal domain-containing protein n=1 Tax=Neobodo designis TaxID=312471 RepID=A0A7S1PP88_NEODS|eukprot:CAMPEP_0174856212 /NCGR_PEP_ID=MMETSP1114-20130205/35343_1 /TAXON_ID=312471 /ORGANISM="Neobodo designis, Strain CCAP 1951/1" /LENGTH=327 /DNA_ID=CAMNT_0016090997 /DNA_START=29 /DNA_END=1012 /DNA_ORIENTATION=-
MPQEVWLGVPDGKLDATPIDAYTARLGGKPTWLRRGSPKSVDCTTCGAGMALLAQLHAPLATFDRILYVFVCRACCGSGKPAVRVLRSQVYNVDYDEEWHAKVAAAQPKTKMFEEADDWGDDEDEAPAPAAAEPAAPAEVPPRYDWSPETHEDTTVGQKGAPLGGFYMDSIPEPRESKQAQQQKGLAGDDESVLRQLEQKNADVVERGGSGGAVEEDDDEDEDPTPDEFVERISRAPRQCLRWQPGGIPLIARRDAFTGPVDPCPCGRPRTFECQVMSPAIYFLSGDKAEADQPLHFSTILVFTCSAHCYAADAPVTEERAIWHEEL